MTNELQSARVLVSEYTRALMHAQPGATIRDASAPYLVSDYRYFGVRPFYDMTGPQALADDLWSPLKQAMPTLQRRPDIFFVGRHDLKPEHGLWVVEMGHLLGDFTGPWLGIPPTGQATYLPYATMHQVADGHIVQTVEFLDVLAVITQAGLNPLSVAQTGGYMMAPGPKTHDGLVPLDPELPDSKATLDLTLTMLTELAESYTSPTDHLSRFWHPDMNWFGPTGIGTSLGFSGYGRGHTVPFETKLETVKIHDWKLAVAQGNFSAVMWWPCLTMRNVGGYMGVPANENLADMRVVDLYRRDGDRLAENWIFIDLLHFLAQQGVDLLADIGGQP